MRFRIQSASKLLYTNLRRGGKFWLYLLHENLEDSFQTRWSQHQKCLFWTFFIMHKHKLNLKTHYRFFKIQFFKRFLSIKVTVKWQIIDFETNFFFCYSTQSFSCSILMMPSRTLSGQWTVDLHQLIGYKWWLQ